MQKRISPRNTFRRKASFVKTMSAYQAQNAALLNNNNLSSDAHSKPNIHQLESPKRAKLIVSRNPHASLRSVPLPR